MSETEPVERALFGAALDIENPEARHEFLERNCQGDTALRQRVERLLALDEKTDEFFGIPALFPDVGETLAAAAALEASPGEGVPGEGDPAAEFGAVIGRYRLLRRLGEGGCGVVYLAEQQEPVQRQVALKIIRLGMDTERVIARFQLERQALAMMNHLNIAQVLDAGATESGRLYFVMELVEGARITDYCDAHRLKTSQRLDLFIKVCLAIQHAHQKGILHRDIKPSNIIITEQNGVPVPKVIDFGIAKAFEGKLADGTATTSDQLIGTPSYMSPEQADASTPDIDTRSDVYSLGALLYELLTGKPPFDSKKLAEVGLGEMRRILREIEPAPPSRLLLSLPAEEVAAVASRHQTDPSQLLARLRGDLDWVVMKALEKDRERRYATANGLATDISRYLNNDPVSARPPSRLYRFRKLYARNRGVFLASAAVVIALFAGLGTSIWFLQRERAALRREMALRAEAETSEKLTRAVFLTRDGNMEAANAALKELGTPPLRPSFDGVTAYRAVGDWLARQGRWREAADRYAYAVQLDQLDLWRPVTLDYQAYGALLMAIGDTGGYTRFCRDAAKKYANEANGDAAGRVLKTCLLQPADAELIGLLRPLGQRAETWFASLRPAMASDWASIPVVMWWYRSGDLERAKRCAEISAQAVDMKSARYATVRLVLALIAFQEGQGDEGRRQMEVGRQVLEASSKVENLVVGMWYDRLYAAMLLREAEKMADMPPQQ